MLVVEEAVRPQLYGQVLRQRKPDFPTISILLTGFLGQGKAVAQALGIQNMALAEYPGIPTMDSKDESIQKSH